LTNPPSFEGGFFAVKSFMAGETKRFRIRLLAVAAILGLLATVIWFGPPAYRHYREKRSLVQAQAFFAQGDFRNALLGARQTLLFNPTNAQAYGIMAEVAELSRSPAVLDLRQRIVEIEPTIENKLLLASAGLHYQSPPFPMTTRILDELSAPASNLVLFHNISAELALRVRRITDAQAHLEAAWRLEPTNRLYELNLAVLRLGSTNVATVAAARATLERFETDVNFGAVALRSLVVDRLAHNDPMAALDYSVRLLGNSHAVLNDRLQHLGILRQLQQSAELAAQLNSLQQSATNAVAVAEIAAWMEAGGFLTNAVEWLNRLPAKLQSQPLVRLSLADCYLAGKDWQALRDFAAKGKWDEMEFLRLAYLSQAWFQLGESLVADSNWRVAVNETGNRFGALMALLKLADRWELKHHREDLLQRIVQKFPNESWARQDLERIYFASGNTLELNRLYSDLFARSPKDIAAKNNLVATSLLLKTNLPQVFTWAQELYAQRPDDPVVVSTYAYALCLQGRAKAGVITMKKLNPHSLKQPAVALYYGVLLAAAGETNEATRFLTIAENRGQFLPEEKRLLVITGKVE
jgi:hypothetical protein